MSTEKQSCPKCGKPMEDGWIVEGMGVRYGPGVWVEGAADLSDATGKKAAKKTKRWITSSYRCVGCGYLESYATAVAEG